MRQRKAPEVLTSGNQRVENLTAGRGTARVLSLKGRWLEGRVLRRSGWLEFEPGESFVGGMSGSPIVDGTGAAIGVVSTSQSSPVIVDRHGWCEASSRPGSDEDQVPGSGPPLYSN
jgi:hypothetical protein